MKLALTGITSGVGIRLAEVALERGHEVRGLVRDPDRADAKRLGALGAALVRGDLDDVAALRQVALGADAFVHMAAHVGDWGSREEFERVNVRGTENALRAAASAAVGRFVQLSSVSVYGRPDHGRVTEDWPRTHSGTAYDDTKADAEAAAFRLGGELDVAVVAVRPPVIYGPYDRNFLPRAIDALRTGRFLLIDGGRAPMNLVWVDHVVDVLLLAAERAREAGVAGEIFNVMDEVSERPPTVREVAMTIAREAGTKPPSRDVPYPVAMVIGHLVFHAFRLLRAKNAPPVTPFVVRILTRDVIYDSSKAVRVLGWKPRLKSLEGVARFAREARK